MAMASLSRRANVTWVQAFCWVTAWAIRMWELPTAT